LDVLYKEYEYIFTTNIDNISIIEKLKVINDDIKLQFCRKLCNTIRTGIDDNDCSNILKLINEKKLHPKTITYDNIDSNNYPIFEYKDRQLVLGDNNSEYMSYKKCSKMFVSSFIDPKDNNRNVPCNKFVEWNILADKYNTLFFILQKLSFYTIFTS